ncbi:hypothetical protein PsYK624_098880 [Phanerochaete sordida]|uniref:Uncharacterized protein n=1 Tax=Phanerochaete sordida TaxID=48140 RepID=A0A9P3GDK0_9APHY|nr:hypothetical protein PsYK624_098880 [Phanerochaete sordida]
MRVAAPVQRDVAAAAYDAVGHGGQPDDRVAARDAERKLYNNIRTVDAILHNIPGASRTVRRISSIRAVVRLEVQVPPAGRRAGPRICSRRNEHIRLGEHCPRILRRPAGRVQRVHQCLRRAEPDKYVDLIVLQLTRSSALAADIIVLIATWMRTFTQWRESRRLHMKLSASTLLLRDGTLYFIALLAMNITQMATFWDTSINANIANVPLTSMPNVLVSRFLINLRQLGAAPDPNSTSTTDTGDLTFAAPARSGVLGDIGGSLDLGFGTPSLTASDASMDSAEIGLEDLQHGGSSL